jgi:RimJ/RimL family protein N-acetyltransferase
MIEYIYNEEDELIPWAGQRIAPWHRFRPDAKAIGYASKGTIRSVTVYDTFSNNDCRIHVASDGKPNWFNREYAVRTMAFPFVQCNFHRISCLISIRNRASVQFTLRFGGWVQEGVQREAGYEGEDLVAFGMLKRDCPWLTKAQKSDCFSLSVPANVLAV